MQLSEVASFDVVRTHLSWPWIAFDASSTCFAFPSSDHQVETRVLAQGAVEAGPAFPLPADLHLPHVPPPADGSRRGHAGLHAFAIAPGAAHVALVGVAEGASVVVTEGPQGERIRSAIEAHAGPGFTAQAITFDRSGTRLWISAESETETALVLIDAQTHALLGVIRSAPFPPPAMHELHVHPQEDAVLLLAACGEDGTFARVARRVDGGGLEAVPTAMDEGSLAAGFVGFSADAARVHLAEADELRTHAWPGLVELSSVELVDDFVSSFAGAVLGEHVYVDGQDAESGEDAVTVFDRSATRGTLAWAPVPSGMWAGRLGSDAVVTVGSKGDPVPGRVVRIAVSEPAPR